MSPSSSSSSSTPDRCQVCENQSESAKKLLRCSQCQQRWFCSKECQRLDWRQHRRVCGRASTTCTSSNSNVDPASAVTTAWKELSNLLASASLKELQQDYHLAKDRVQTLKDQQQQEPEQPEQQDINVSSRPTCKKRIQQEDDVPPKGTPVPKASTNSKPSRTKVANSNPQSDSSYKYKYWDYFIEDMVQLQCYQILLRPIADSKPINLESLRINSKIESCCSSASSVTVHYQDEATLALQLPRKMQSISQNNPPRVCLVDHGAAVSVRLSYAAGDDSVYCDAATALLPAKSSAISLLQPEQCHRLACRYCHQRLLPSAPANTSTKTTTIQRVLPLASSRWDDLQDYLYCYEGQTVVDFTAVSAGQQPGTLLEDDTVLVVHGDDLMTMEDSDMSTTCAAVSVVAIPGYGADGTEGGNHDDGERQSNRPSLAEQLAPDRDPSAIVRGSRKWRPAVGGATVTCSCCASTLGFAVTPSDTATEESLSSSPPPPPSLGYRLLKHKLALLQENDNSNDCYSRNTVSKPLQTISSFIAHEMIRYAETKAIFTFVVRMDQSSTHNMMLGAVPQPPLQPLLLLRLVSWDTVATMSFENDTCGTQDLQWRRISKIIFEETTVDPDGENGSNNVDRNSSLWAWTMASGDWCCPPPTSSLNTKRNPTETEAKQEATANASDNVDEKDAAAPSFAASMVRLCLSPHEWHALSHELRSASRCFCAEVVQATVAAKMGPALVQVPHHEGRMGLAAVAL